MQFKIITGVAAPKGRARAPQIQELTDALATLPVDASFVVAESEIAFEIFRAHVARANRQTKDKQFILRRAKDKLSAQVWAVASKDYSAHAPAAEPAKKGGKGK